MPRKKLKLTDKSYKSVLDMVRDFSEPNFVENLERTIDKKEEDEKKKREKNGSSRNSK